MEEIAFTVSARTARLIGQENFANAEGAVVELIKNCYDADATISVLIIDIQKNKMFIFDNGEGMSELTIRNHWMTIGTNDKKINIKSVNNRIKTGAKGIGRFALDRIGKKCCMHSKSLSENCILWEVDWNQFESNKSVISEITAQLSILDNSSFKEEILRIFKIYDIDENLLLNWDEEKGTLIEINELRDDWGENNLSSLFINLESLTPPLENSFFSIYFFESDNKNTYGKVQSAEFDDYDYKVFAEVNSDQEATIKITRNEIDVKELKRINFFENTILKQPQYSLKVFEDNNYEIHTSLYELVAGYSKTRSNSNISQIGPFTFIFYYLKRGGGQEEKDSGVGKFPYKNVNYRDRSNWLNKFGGIKIFRDNFRVRPYGEIGSSSWDWLDLGRGALGNPTVTRLGYRVRPQQIYGAINISRIGNINFEDKSSREGIQENDTFILFKEIIKSIINIYENDRNQIMMSLKKIYDDNDKVEQKKKAADELINNIKQNVSKNETILKDAIEVYKEELEELRDEQKLLRVLASTGLIVTSFTHELKNLSDTIVPRTEDLKISLHKCIDKEKLKMLPQYFDPFTMIEDMRIQDLRLKYWLDFAISSVRKDKRKRKVINMVAYIEGLERSWNSLLSRREIKLIIDKSMFLEVRFNGFEIDLDGIFNNLISNSVDAFSRPESGTERYIKLSFYYNVSDSQGISVLYSDSGPGLDPEIIDSNKIFEPFFTTKRDIRTGEKIGTGLGLWLVKSTLEEYKGQIELQPSNFGFKARITLPHHL